MFGFTWPTSALADVAPLGGVEDRYETNTCLEVLGAQKALGQREQVGQAMANDVVELLFGS